MNGQNKQVGEQKNYDTHKVQMKNQDLAFLYIKEKLQEILKTMTYYKQNVFFLGHFCTEVPSVLIREHGTQHVKI